MVDLNQLAETVADNIVHKLFGVRLDDRLGEIRELVRDELNGLLYLPAEPDKHGELSDMDQMAVMLSVADWREIADELLEEADASSEGELTAKYREEHPEEDEEDSDEYEKTIEALHEEDAKAVCYVNAYSTMRCGDHVLDALEQNGWPR
jgi:hypothetical protein